MDPPPPSFDHPHHRRGHPYPDQHNHFPGGSAAGGGGGGAAPLRSRYEYYSYEPLPIPAPAPAPAPALYHHHHHHHHHPRAAHLHQPPSPQPPTLPPPPQHRHEGPHYVAPLRAPPCAYSSPPPYQNPTPHYTYHSHQRHSDGDFRPTDEMHRGPSYHHYHPQQQQQLPWDEAEDERRRYTAAHQPRLSPPGSWKRQRCTAHDCADLESTSSSGPPSHRPRQQPHPNYALDDSFSDRTTTHPGYNSHEGFSMHSDSNGNRKMQMPSHMTVPSSPNSTGVGYPRRTTQKSAPTRVSVWQRIEENPTAHAQSSPRQLPKEVHISPCKSNNSGPASKEMSSMISVDCKGKSVSDNDVDSTTGIKKCAGKKNEKVLASVLVKPSPGSKGKEASVKKVIRKPDKVLKNLEPSVKKVTRKPDKVQKNLVGSTARSMGFTACPGAGVKKVKKIIIKKIVRKIGSKDQQVSSSVVSEKRDSIDASVNAYEKEEGEIIASSFEKDLISSHNLVSTTNTAGVGASSFEKDLISSHNLVSTIDTAGVGNGVDVQMEENNESTNPSKMNAVSAVESTDVLDPDSESEHPGKDQYRSSMVPGGNNITSPIESTEVLAASGSECPGNEDDRSPGDSSVWTADFVSEKQEGKIQALSSERQIATVSSSAKNCDECEDYTVDKSKVGKDVSENNAVYFDRAKLPHNTTEFSGIEDAGREDGEILVGTNERAVIGDPSAAEVSVSIREVDQGNDSKVIDLDDSMGAPWTTEEADVSQVARGEEGNMCTHSVDKDCMSVSSCGTLNTMEGSVNESIEEEEGRMLKEPRQANNTSVEHHAEVSNTTKLCLNEDIQKNENQMPVEAQKINTSEKIHQVSNTTEVITSMFVGTEVGDSVVGSNERHAGTRNNSVNTPEFDEANGPEDNCTEDLLLNVRTAFNESEVPLEVDNTHIFNSPSSTKVDNTNVPPLDDGPMDDSTCDIVLNSGVRWNQAAELMHLHRAYMSPKNDSTLLPSRESSSLSGNSEHSVPTTLTLGSKIYFSSAESKGQPKENYDLVEGQQRLDVSRVTEFDSLGKGKGIADDDLISAGIQNWLTLPQTVNNSTTVGKLLNNGATVRKDSLGVEQSMDDDAFVSQDLTEDMNQHGSVHAFFSQDQTVRLCEIDLPQSDLLAPKESSGDIQNQCVLSGLHSISPINVSDQYDYQKVDIPVSNPNDPVSAFESTDIMDAEILSSEVSVDPDHSYHSNTEDPGVESSTKQDLLSSWIEAVVSEAKKEHQLPSISSPDKLLLAPKDDSGRAGLDHVVKSPQANFTSSMPPKVAPKQASSPSLSLETPRLSQNARNRTWHRGNMVSSTSSLQASHPSGLPPKLPLKKNGKTQNSYIRKGNALIRNPATGNQSHSSSSLDTQSKLNKPVMRRSMNFVRKVDSNDFVAHSNMSVERPKTPPLLVHTKSINCTTNLLEQLSQTMQKQHVPETEKEDSIGMLNSSADIPSIKSSQKTEPLDARKVVYVRPKSNKLVAAQRHHPVDSIICSMDKVLPLQPPTTSDLYFKKRNNQIVLSSSTSDGQNAKDMTPSESLNSGENKGLTIASSKNSIPGVKNRQHKALHTTNNGGSFSHVWTLSGKQQQKNGFVGTSHMKAFPRILPWKRKIYYKDFRSRHPSLLNTRSLQIVRKLLQTRKRDMVYTVSTDGFSLKKSGVLSVGGSSLKWLRSIEKHTQKDNEAATRAAVEVERKRREKRKRQFLRDKDQYSVSVTGSQLRNNNQASSNLMSSTCNEYVRVNNGNQLVRNPKKVIRMLASEKVRWSLHTVRSRLAKKQKYCQFFTRFGECKKPGGKCPYIHDRAKVAICTKFLKGLCSHKSCKLTHKVLPERMPDCSYFQRGLCTNTACPYRHVKVNSNALVCEDFLRGYCADGDECHKKHSYVCPVFEATGECPQQSTCKLHHPKKKIKSTKSRQDIFQNSSWGRYFDTSIDHDSEMMKVSSDEGERQKSQDFLCGGDIVDFICLNADGDDVADFDALDGIQLMELDSEDSNAYADKLDAAIKPLRIMRTARI